MTINTYMFYCEICNWKKISDGSEIQDLVEIKTSSILSSLPKYDHINKKTIPPKFKKQSKRFKCPSCGRAVIPKKISTSEEAPNEKNKPNGSQESSS